MPPELTVQTPLVVAEWEEALKQHPDRAYVNYISQGLKFGYRYNRRAPLVSARANMQSADLHPEVITEYLQKEITLGRMTGPFVAAQVPQGLHIS